jgi:N-methylhydantoinase A
MAQLRDAFGAEHERTYGHRGTGQQVEIVNLRLRATASHRDGRFDVFAPTHSAPSAPTFARSAYFGPQHGAIATPVIRRYQVGSEPLAGPVIVEDMDATTVVPPGAAVRLDGLGNLVITF